MRRRLYRARLPVCLGSKPCPVHLVDQRQLWANQQTSSDLKLSSEKCHERNMWRVIEGRHHQRCCSR
jgi:hypothetical protein